MKWGYVPFVGLVIAYKKYRAAKKKYGMTLKRNRELIKKLRENPTNEASEDVCIANSAMWEAYYEMGIEFHYAVLGLSYTGSVLVITIAILFRHH